MLRNYNGTQRKHLGKNHGDFCRGVLLTKEMVSLTIPVLKNGINTHPWKVTCVTLCLLGLLVLSLSSQSFLIGSDCNRNHIR